MRELIGPEREHAKVYTYSFRVSLETVASVESVTEYLHSLIEDDGYGPFDSVQVCAIRNKGKRND